ncbi:MAG TPA: MBL fold metallo-hydrolase [Burkholderiales bacterium]|nr:MBL fold metallo-hydrolase [Burkholderiales bacterium]
MTAISEIAPDVYRICTYVPEIDLQFCQFLVKDEQPLLWETGMKQLFPTVREAVAKIIDPATLRWISFSHFEPDECGSLNDWLTLAPRAQAVCSEVGAMVFVNDGALRPALGVTKDALIETGKYRFRLYPTPHLPHGWDAAILFEETNRTLLCSDLLHHAGDVEPCTESDVIGRTRHAMQTMQSTSLLDYMPWTPKTESRLKELAALAPRTCATMHGSAFRGDGARALRELASVMREVLGTT